MEKKINLKLVEKETAAGIFGTGLVEIEIGLILIVASLAMMFDDIRYYIDILYVVPIIFIILAIKHIVNPRMGVVKFARKRLRRSRFMLISITTFLVVMVTLTVVGGSSSIVESINPRWIISGIVFFICIAIAYFLNFTRMYLYAFLLVAAFNMSEEIREHPGIISEGGYVYLLASIVLIVIGLIYLFKFLKKYPIAESGISND